MQTQSFRSQGFANRFGFAGFGLAAVALGMMAACSVSGQSHRQDAGATKDDRSTRRSAVVVAEAASAPKTPAPMDAPVAAPMAAPPAAPRAEPTPARPPALKPVSGAKKTDAKRREQRPMEIAFADSAKEADRDDDLQATEPFNREGYDHISDNPFRQVAVSPLSTFSIDVDTASYANMRRFLRSGVRPPKDSVRIEEMINYFDYDYAQPDGEHPFAVNVEVAEAPWADAHRLVRIGLKGEEMARDERPASNLVFLLDVSGSMHSPNKLPLLKEALGMLVNQLDERDSVAIAVYAGASGLVLPPTPASDRHRILGALERLRAGGSTNGAAGIQLAYQTAQRHFVKGGVNRVILATDGDFNVGTTDRGSLVRLVEEKAKKGVFLTVLGFGMGNYQDATLEQIADKGNGNYAYIDTRNEAQKVLVEQIGGTLVTIAKDVKIQVEFNPAQVASWRLIGYENRLLRDEDFNDDKKDAGEIGAGHTVTALYEIVPTSAESVSPPGVDPLKYQQPRELSGAARSQELLTVKLRYKAPDGDTSTLLSHSVVDRGRRLRHASEDFQFAAAVAAFGMLLRSSEHKGGTTFETVLSLAENGLGDDAHGYRAEFVELVQQARKL